MRKVFRARHLQELRSRCQPVQALLNTLYQKNWVIYGKRPFAHPRSLVEYPGRYEVVSRHLNSSP